MHLRVMLLGACAAGSFVLSVPATAAVQVYTNATAFTTATSPSTYVFPFAANDTDLGTSYALGPASFSAVDLHGFNDCFYGCGIPYLGAVAISPLLSVTTDASAIGFYFGTINLAISSETIAYNVNGVVGTFDVPASPSTAFLGFSGLSGSTMLTFTNTDAELDTTKFLAATTPVNGAVPEPATWAMMLVGFGGIGMALRRKRKPVLARQVA